MMMTKMRIDRLTRTDFWKSDWRLSRWSVGPSRSTLLKDRLMVYGLPLGSRLLFWRSLKLIADVVFAVRAVSEGVWKSRGMDELGSRRDDGRLDFANFWGWCDEGVLLRRECGPNFDAFFRLKSDREKIARQLLQIVWKVHLFLESNVWKSHSFASWFLRFLTPQCFTENRSTAISLVSSPQFCWRLVTKGIFFSCILSLWLNQ